MNNRLKKAYAVGSIPVIDLGGILLNGQLLPEASVNLVIKQFNRHGLVAGATGSGKTKTLQVLCEQLSLAGVPCLIMDIKGDISGLGMPGVSNPAIKERCQSLQLDFTPHAFPVELLSISQTIPGVPLRATVLDFGALLFSRMLELNEAQAGVVTLLFEYAKDHQLELIDLDDFKALLKFSQTDIGKEEIEKQYGLLSPASVGTVLRKIIEISSQGGDLFFGEPAFEVQDLIRTHQEQGVISILRMMDMQDKPYLFSTFMIKLLSDIYRQLPELGDPEKPVLMLFIDEAHLIFNHASKALLNLMDTIVKLIRSKGVGIIFCTQTPNDIPENILSQLGLKVQHALRAFTAKDRQAIKLMAKNFPPTADYQIEDLLTTLGTGEALITAIDEKGSPTPLVQCLIRVPESRMGTLTNQEANQILQQSLLYSKYSKRIETHSAADSLSSKDTTTTSKPAKTAQSKATYTPTNIVEKLSKNTLVRQVTRDVFRKLMQFILSMLKRSR